MLEESSSSPFEGPEKLLEIWFAPSAADVPDAQSPEHGRTGLRKIEQNVWEEMLDIVRCKILSTVQGQDMDAYLLSESSLFISPHRLILKTCGTTLNLLGLPRILEIASTHAKMHSVYRCFYSRKAFMFPERQQGPHRDWKHEVEYLDNLFQEGAAYTVGKVNGDHWLLYITNPVGGSIDSLPQTRNQEALPDYTIEILMSGLSPQAREPFHSSSVLPEQASSHAQALSSLLGITEIFPSDLTTLDAYSFSPCGYSSNALIRWGDDPSLGLSGSSAQGAEGYYTIHVTPEEGWSYASFECNVPLAVSAGASGTQLIPDLETLVRRVVAVFQPGRLSLTLFISSGEDESAVEAAQKAFRAALTTAAPFKGPNSGTNVGTYRRTDKINYEFGGYDLAFASFELIDAQQ
ncbi:S-adenosylmethionine decarboxylase [Mycena floridula]|nr:S-adenosylmethionine decarboxylase [Mycena floridula]